jgi:anti-anti-sigma regulatory factor
MHRIHGVEVCVTDDALHAVIITIWGSLDTEMERILRVEFDKTLRRNRKAGVIVDLADTDHVSPAAIARLLDFSKHLRKDSIPLYLVVNNELEEHFRRYRVTERLTLVRNIDAAKERLGITE